MALTVEEWEWLSDRNKADLRVAMVEATKLSYMEIEKVLGTRDLQEVQEAEKYVKQCFVTIKHPESGNYAS